MVANYETISAALFSAPIMRSLPRLATADLPQLADIWIKKYGKNWSTTITNTDLVDQMRLYFVPYWVIDGAATASWSAQIGQDIPMTRECGRCYGRGRVRPSENNAMNVDHGELVICTKCGGSGREQYMETKFFQQSGFANAQLDGHIISNYADGLPVNRLKKQDMDAPQERVERAELDSIFVLKPTYTSLEQGKLVATQVLRDALTYNAEQTASKLGPVRDLQLFNIQDQQISPYIWLYPIFLGAYSDEDGTPRSVCIDTITGEMLVDLPKSVQNKLRTRTLIYIVASGVLILAALLIGLVILR